MSLFSKYPDDYFRVVPTVRGDGSPTWSVREFRWVADSIEIVWHCQCGTKEEAEKARQHLMSGKE
jgi:hypothetical protein